MYKRRAVILTVVSKNRKNEMKTRFQIWICYRSDIDIGIWVWSRERHLISWKEKRPNGRMSDLFPCRSWPCNPAPDGQQEIWYSSSHSVVLCVLIGHVLAVGSIVSKVTSFHPYRLNSSLYVSGATCWPGVLHSFFRCGTMPEREENVSRRQTTKLQLNFGLFP